MPIFTRMNKLNDKKLLRFYLWVGLAFLTLWLLHELSNNPETFYERAVNNIWRLVYVMVLNFILFEYTIPFIGKKRKLLLYNILVAIPIIFFFLMLYSWGLYVWRLIGIGINIYTPLTTFDSTGHGISEQMSYSMMSVSFLELSGISIIIQN